MTYRNIFFYSLTITALLLIYYLFIFVSFIFNNDLILTISSIFFIPLIIITSFYKWLLVKENREFLFAISTTIFMEILGSICMIVLLKWPFIILPNVHPTNSDYDIMNPIFCLIKLWQYMERSGLIGVALGILLSVLGIMLLRRKFFYSKSE